MSLRFRSIQRLAAKSGRMIQVTEFCKDFVHQTEHSNLMSLTMSIRTVSFLIQQILQVSYVSFSAH